MRSPSTHRSSPHAEPRELLARTVRRREQLPCIRALEFAFPHPPESEAGTPRPNRPVDWRRQGRSVCLVWPQLTQISTPNVFYQVSMYREATALEALTSRVRKD